MLATFATSSRRDAQYGRNIFN